MLDRSRSMLAGASLAFILLSTLAVADVIAPQSGNLTLGGHWSPIESAAGATFRWVDHDAEFVIHKPGESYVTVDVRLEAGPGLGTTQFPFIVRDGSNHQVSGVFVRGNQTVSLVLPTQPDSDNRFTLSVLGGGHRVPSDKRILNFRVFSLSDGATKAAAGQSPSITGNGVSIGDRGWYPLETFGGKTFRWINNDAAFTVTWPHDQQTKVRIIAEPGPGIGANSFDLDLQDATGHELGRQHIVNEGIANFDVTLHQGSNSFRLHVDGGGKAAHGDKRTLNFRVFGLSALE